MNPEKRSIPVIAMHPHRKYVCLLRVAIRRRTKATAILLAPTAKTKNTIPTTSSFIADAALTADTVAACEPSPRTADAVSMAVERKKRN
jgi:hypothetical protein